jgi:hypothetical protein
MEADHDRTGIALVRRDLDHALVGELEVVTLQPVEDRQRALAGVQRQIRSGGAICRRRRTREQERAQRINDAAAVCTGQRDAIVRGRRHDRQLLDCPDQAVCTPA